MPIRALLFDLWGTLIADSGQGPEPRHRARVRLAAEALRGAGHPYPEEAVSDAIRASSEEHYALHPQGLDIAAPDRVELFLRHLEPGLLGRLPPDTPRAIEDALIEAFLLDPPAAAPGAREVLQEAQRRGLALALVSNAGITPGFALRLLLARHGLLPYLEVLTFSDEARLAKPAPAIFHCTLDALGVAAEDAVFIGDIPDYDVRGPQEVGMWTVQVGDQHLDGVEPHARIATLPELFPALERLGLLGG